MAAAPAAAEIALGLAQKQVTHITKSVAGEQTKSEKQAWGGLAKPKTIRATIRAPDHIARPDMQFEHVLVGKA